MEWRRVASVFVGAALALTVGCQPQGQQQATSQPAVDTAAIRSAVRSVNTAFEKAANAGDMKKAMSFYTEDAVVAPPMAPPISGRDSILAFMKRTIPAGATFKVDTREIEPLGPDRAYTMGVTTVSVTPEGAGQAQTSEFTYFALVRRTPDGWRYYREAYNLNHPPKSGGGE